MTAWGLVSTVKAPADKVLAFVAHHLSLGASHLWLYFDDPADLARAAVAQLPSVTATACDDAHWTRLKGRPDRHQNRQTKNAQAAWKACPLPWLGHIDVDEFLWPRAPVADILASVPRDQPTLRMEPFEAMHDPALPDDIFTARQFRGPLKPRFSHLRDPALGPYAEILPDGHLSHTNGKSFFRTGIPGLSVRLHGAFRHGGRLPGPAFDPRLPLLHFHAQDQAEWLRALPFRLSRGAYQYHADLQAHLLAADPAEVARFYQRTQMLTPETAELLRSEARLIEADLAFRAKVATLQRPA